MSNWDVIVIGSGLGGLSVGALLADAGKKVLVLEQGSDLGGRLTCVEYQGHVLENGISSPVMGIHLEELYSRLGIESQFPEIITKGFTALAYFDGKWQELNPPRDELQRILVDKIGKKSYQELAEYDDIGLNKWVSQWTTNEQVHRWFEYLGMLICLTDTYETTSAGDFLVRLKEVLDRRGKLKDFYGLVRGGPVELLKPLAEVIRKKGSEIRFNSVVSEIVIENGEARGVLVEKEKRLFPAHIVDTEMIEAPRVVCTLPVWDLFKVIPEDECPPWYVDWVKRIYHKVAYVVGIINGVDKRPWDYDLFAGYVPESPRLGKDTTFFFYGDVPGHSPDGQWMINLALQTSYHWWPSFFEADQAKTKRDLRRYFDLLREDRREFFPEWEKHILWEICYSHPIDIINSPSISGKHRVDKDLHGIKNLHLVSDTLRHGGGRGIWMQQSVREALLCADELLGKKKADY